MARPKGSKNQPKNTSPKYQVLNFEKDFALSEKLNTSYGYVKYGASDDYPTKLLQLYAASPTFHSCIDFASSAILGEGIDYDAMAFDGSQTVPNYQYDWNELIKRLSLDYMLFGSYALEIIKNKDGKTFSFYHLPYDGVRASEYDEDGVINYYLYSTDWKRISTNPPITIDAFEMREEDAIEGGKPYLYVYKPYSPCTEGYYPTPSYIAALKAIQAECEFLNYDLKSATNCFVPTGALVLNDVETDEQRRAIIDSVQRMFQGTENSSQVMISFRNNEESSIPQFVPFASNASQNVNLFQDSNKRNIDRILTAFKIGNESLIGSPTMGADGFSSEADKMETAFKIYMKMVGNSNRMAVIQSINNCFRMNGIDVEIIMKDLSFGEDNEDKTANTDAVDKNQDTSSSNVEEQVVQ